MSVLLTSQFYSPGRIIMIDMDASRLELAKQFGATDTVQVGAEDPVGKVMQMTQGLGVDVAIAGGGRLGDFRHLSENRGSRRQHCRVGVRKPVELHIENRGSRTSPSRWAGEYQHDADAPQDPAQVARSIQRE
jgi:alcohol dehydrogenase